MQDAYELISNAVAAIGGRNTYIVSGVQWNGYAPEGQRWSEGIVSIDGRLVPFHASGSAITDVLMFADDNPTELDYYDGNSRGALREYWAEAVPAEQITGGTVIAEMKAAFNTSQMWGILDVLRGDFYQTRSDFHVIQAIVANTLLNRPYIIKQERKQLDYGSADDFSTTFTFTPVKTNLPNFDFQVWGLMQANTPGAPVVPTDVTRSVNTVYQGDGVINIVATKAQFNLPPNTTVISLFCTYREYSEPAAI
jgi:hypothetical protein